MFLPAFHRVAADRLDVRHSDVRRRIHASRRILASLLRIRAVRRGTVAEETRFDASRARSRAQTKARRRAPVAT